MKRYIPYFQILLAAALWGVIGLFNVNLFNAGLSSASVVVVRNLGGLIVLGLVLLIYDRNVFKIKLKHLPYFFGTGIISVLLFTLCYFSAQKMGSLAISAILLYTAPAFVVILSSILFKDKITRSKLTALILAFLGCAFVSGIWIGNLTVTVLSLLLGIGSGFFYSLYSIFGRYALTHYGPFTVTFYTFAFAGIGSLFLIRPTELIPCMKDGSTLFLILGLIVISTVLPYIFYTKGLAKLDSGKASILASIEPVVAAIVGVVAFGEPLSVMIILGMLCILVSVYILR